MIAVGIIEEVVYDLWNPHGAHRHEHRGEITPRESVTVLVEALMVGAGDTFETTRVDVHARPFDMRCNLSVQVGVGGLE